MFNVEKTTHEAIQWIRDWFEANGKTYGENAKAEVSEEVELAEGRDAFLLCTDGFWEYVYENEMEQCLKEADSPKDWVRRMEKILIHLPKTIQIRRYLNLLRQPRPILLNS